MAKTESDWRDDILDAEVGQVWEFEFAEAVDEPHMQRAAVTGEHMVVAVERCGAVRRVYFTGFWVSSHAPRDPANGCFGAEWPPSDWDLNHPAPAGHHTSRAFHRAKRIS